MKSDMQEAVSFLYDLPKFTTKNSLDHTRKLMRLLGAPCLDRKIIHVAGSNGKGSVCCFLYSMLLSAGKSAAMFTSPHLVDIRERFQIDGNMVSEEDFLFAFGRVKEVSEKLVQNNDNHPTFFEFIFAMAMVIFGKAGTEYIILETGLGGRLDATNSYPRPILSIITSISLEHTEILGDTLGKIAAEKAGILKAGVPVVFIDEDPEAAQVIRSRAEQIGCPYSAVSDKKFYNYEIKENGIDFSFLTAYDRANDEGGVRVTRQTTADRIWNVPGYARWQVQNAALAVAAMRRLHLMPDDIIQRGLSTAVWPGRMQQIRPGVWLDGAHNPSGIAAFVQTVRRITSEDAFSPLLVFSMVREKDIRTAVHMLTDGICWEAIAVAAVPGERGVPTGTLTKMIREAIFCPVEAFASPGAALSAMCACQKPGQQLFCTGSLYFVGALLEDV